MFSLRSTENNWKTTKHYKENKVIMSQTTIKHARSVQIQQRVFMSEGDIP
jgi:hypothetical protein